MDTRFYTAGHNDGYAHGQLHGRFEGRALGQEKCYELWEEVGYYQGWAEFWLENAERKPRFVQTPSSAADKGRALNHAKTLINLIQTFPTSNPSGAAATIPEEGAAPVDLPTHLSHIRARYKLLCSSLGMRPRMVVGQVIETAGDEGVVQGVESRQLAF